MMHVGGLRCDGAQVGRFSSLVQLKSKVSLLEVPTSCHVQKSLNRILINEGILI